MAGCWPGLAEARNTSGVPVEPREPSERELRHAAAKRAADRHDVLAVAEAVTEAAARKPRDYSVGPAKPDRHAPRTVTGEPPRLVYAPDEIELNCCVAEQQDGQWRHDRACMARSRPVPPR